MAHRASAVFLSALLAACGARQAPAVAQSQSQSQSQAPPALVRAADPCGLAITGDGWTWVPLERPTRFAWKGVPPAKDHVVLFAFDPSSVHQLRPDPPVSFDYLSRFVETAAANLAEDNKTCDAFDQPKELAEIVGVDRIITVCFHPSQYYANARFDECGPCFGAASPPTSSRPQYANGFFHALVRDDALTFVVILSNDATGVAPIADVIGARGKDR
jgi:hypothetical protein